MIEAWLDNQTISTCKNAFWTRLGGNHFRVQPDVLKGKVFMLQIFTEDIWEHLNNMHRLYIVDSVD